MKIILPATALTLAIAAPLISQDIVIEPGPYDGGRLRTNPVVDFHAFNQWIGLGDSPTTGNGNVGWNEEGIWWSFLRFPTVGLGSPMRNPELFNAISTGSVSLEIAVRWTEVAPALEGIIEPGVTVSCYLVPGMEIPDGVLPTWPNSWIGEFSEVFKFAEIDPATASVLRSNGADFSFSPPSVSEIAAATQSYDLTAAIQAAIESGALTDSTPWGIIFYTEEAEPLTANDPKWADRRQTVLDLYNAVVRVSETTTATWGGYPVDEEGWVDTGDWLGWVYVSDAPVIYVLSLDAWMYMSEPSETQNGAWGFVFRS